ncbi:MAG: DNA polymerase III subunit epsilon [Atopobiaceae bacterium]|jgi:ATP-dependent DNA helicase DinG|nr:DNA polymerase III subunit epsilon [Atopobiaceae bacterium]MCI2173670.1 DNA polymerase III subunit epsilon [Atopobiaceae bacterium]MCI2207688.1 DNA polymerase III subunit epsilon [Atopobiaceae bacterium]
MGDSVGGESSRTIASLILPGTPAGIRRMYLGLPEEAKTRDFGLLEEDVVVLDTETTGLSFSSCELIEVAAARLRGQEVVERYRTYVHPSTPIPREISQLTGITDLDVADAPRATEAVRGLAEFVGGDPILAHNATFDRNFVEKVAGGREVSDIWIDTLALSRIGLPAISSHRLADMAEAFGCASVSHRAMDDVDALAGMWRIILCGLAHLPVGLLGALADMHPEADWSYRPIISHLALEGHGTPFSLESVRKEMLKQCVDKAHEDAAAEGRVMTAPTKAEVAEEFAQGGIVPRMYAGYERRPDQLAMAEEVRSALATSSHRALEAGTGVGKSIAYLLPLALFARRNDVTVGIATKTNALSDQLMTHELPALSKAMGSGLSFTCLKGYDHYPCLRRLERATLAELPLDQAKARGRGRHAAEEDMLTSIATTYAFACQSPDGDLDALGIRWRSVPRDMLTVSSNECERVRCPYYPDACMLHGARRRAACADVVVTNHSLLLRNVEADGKILPPIRHWVVDEAHSFESEARRQWALEVSADRAKAAFEELGGVRSGAIHSLMVQAADVESSTLLVGLLTKASAAVSRAAVCSADFFDAVRGLASVRAGNGGYDDMTIWLGDDVRSTPEWAAVEVASAPLIERLDAVVKQLDEAVAAASEAIEKPTADLSDATRSLRDLLAAAKLVCDGTDESYVFSAQVSRSRAKVGTERLVAEKLDIGSELAERWLPDMMSVTFTSATIAVGDDFSHFDHAVGLDLLPSGSHKDVRLESSYDFDQNMCVVVTKDLPEPNDRAYLPALVELLYDVHVAMDGSVLTLFTNRREMEQAYESLRPRLSAAGLDLACQERSSSVRQVRDRFLSERSLSLFALKSFWEGFDAAGDTLRCVVIPKLPFSSPSDPVVRERARRDDRAWWRYSLPEAVISVKQAAGRLIRTSTDTGVLVLADSRLVHKRYGRAFVSSMPSHTCMELESDNVSRFIETWRASHE